MALPFTPAELLADVPQTTQDPCQATRLAWLAFPKKIYEFFSYAFSADGNSLTNAFINLITPVGSYLDSIDATLDDGTPTTPWLLCNGDVKATATFPALSAKIGTTFEAAFGAPGAGNFRLPDFRERFMYPKGAVHALGAIGGAEDVTLTLAQTPAHTHDILIPEDNGGVDNVYAVSLQGDNTSANQTYTSTSKGGGLSHENMAPYLVGGYRYIKT